MRKDLEAILSQRLSLETTFHIKRCVVDLVKIENALHQVERGGADTETDGAATREPSTTPVNPGATARLVAALWAIIEHPESMIMTSHRIHAEAALHMAQLPESDENEIRRKAWADRQEKAPVVPVSEDVETAKIKEQLKRLRFVSCSLKHHASVVDLAFVIESVILDIAAALDRIAAAAGSKE